MFPKVDNYSVVRLLEREIFLRRVGKHHLYLVLAVFMHNDPRRPLVQHIAGRMRPVDLGRHIAQRIETTRPCGEKPPLQHRKTVRHFVDRFHRRGLGRSDPSEELTESLLG